MHRRPTTVPAVTSRREVLLAAGSALALRRSDLQVARRPSYLAVLLRRRDELERLVASFDAAGAQLRKNACSPSIRKQLRAARQAEVRASQALERLEWVIADTPAETLDDVALKVRFCAELQGYGARPTHWRAPFTVEEQLLRTIIADLKRLKENPA
jgi:predicted aminopeptidase